MSDNNEHQIRWSWFKIIITTALLVLGGLDIYFALAPIIEEDYTPKSFANLAFAIITIFYMFSVIKVKKNFEWVFWACSFGLVIFCSMMFIHYETLFQ